jgi:competence protein ComGC
MEKGRSERKEAKGREVFYIILLILLILILFLRPNDKKEERRIENSNSFEIKNLSNDPIIKFELLKNKKIDNKEGRNIFEPLKPKLESKPVEEKIEEKIEEELIIPFKLICIIEEQNSRIAAVSKDEEILFVRKGDVLDGELEIFEIEEEGVIFKSLKNGKTKKIEFEER